VDARFIVGKFVSANGKYWLDYLLVLNNRNRKNKSLLVFCQGRLSTIESSFELLPSMLEAGHNILLFNYRGVGTPGRATFKSVCRDAISAHIFGQKVVSGLLAGKWGPPDLYQQISQEALGKTGLLGYSLGGWPAVYASSVVFAKAKSGPGVLALMDTGSDMMQVLCERGWFFRLFIPTLLLSPRLNNLRLVRSPYPAIKLFAHGDLDKTWYQETNAEGQSTMHPGFDLSHGKKLFAAAPGRLPRFFQLRNSGHKHMQESDRVTFGLFLVAILKGLQG
jgi:hypothetical protein